MLRTGSRSNNFKVKLYTPTRHGTFLRDPMGVDSDLLSGRVRLRYPLTLEATHVS